MLGNIIFHIKKITTHERILVINVSTREKKKINETKKPNGKFVYQKKKKPREIMMLTIHLFRV